MPNHFVENASNRLCYWENVVSCDSRNRLAFLVYFYFFKQKNVSCNIWYKIYMEGGKKETSCTLPHLFYNNHAITSTKKLYDEDVYQEAISKSFSSLFFIITVFYKVREEVSERWQNNKVQD